MVYSRHDPYQWFTQDFIMDRVQQGPNGQRQGWSLTLSYGCKECSKLPQRGSGLRPGHPTFSYNKSALGDVSCCILGAFCSKKSYPVQHRKGSVRFWKPCGIELWQYIDDDDKIACFNMCWKNILPHPNQEKQISRVKTEHSPISEVGLQPANTQTRHS